jgi:hypothetical protein
MRSFYLLDALPTCAQKNTGSVPLWYGFETDGRMAILVIPFNFIDVIVDNSTKNCPGMDQERSMRVLVNVIMATLTTDYKKDQIHLPEILKRLR